VDAAGKVDARFAFVTLYAVHDKKWLANEYHLVSARPRPQTILKEIPPNWPTPDVAKLLPDLLKGSPSRFFVMDGDQGRAGWYDEDTRSYPDARKIEAKERELLLAGDIGLAGQIWPSRFRTAIGTEGTLAELIQDPAHAKLIGLRYKRVPVARYEKSTAETETTWWIDPARDDMPSEIMTLHREKPGDEPTLETHTHYLEYAQLPGGKWYPTHWRTDRTDRNPRTGKGVKSAQYYRLQILLELKLGEEWFQGLQKERPRASTQTATQRAPDKAP
jgi:hypothetical protein